MGGEGLLKPPWTCLQSTGGQRKSQKFNIYSLLNSNSSCPLNSLKGCIPNSTPQFSEYKEMEFQAQCLLLNSMQNFKNFTTGKSQGFFLCVCMHV